MSHNCHCAEWAYQKGKDFHGHPLQGARPPQSGDKVA
jgi:hypothetical protein